MEAAQRVIDLLLFAFCAIAIFSVGTVTVRRLIPFGVSRLETVALSLGIGTVVVSYGVLLFGFLGWLHRTVLYLWLGICYALGSIELGNTFRGNRFIEPFTESWADLTVSERVWVVVLVFLNLLALVLCFVPPTLQTEWDSLSYHLAIPKLYWMEGRIHYIAFTHHAQFPMTAQMLYLLGLGLTDLKSTSVAKLFHWLFFVICQLNMLCWGTATKQRSLKFGLYSAISFAALPIAFFEATTAYVDLALTAYGLLCLFAVSRFHSQPNGRWLVIAGIFAGAAAGTKYTGLLLIALLVIFGGWAILRVKEPRWAHLTVGTLLALLVASPWYVKNWLWTKNPVFPFAYSVFGGRNWTKEMAQTYTISNREFGGSRDILTLLSMPFNLTLNEIRFGRCAREWLRSCKQRGECGMQWKCGKFDNQDLPALGIGVLPLALGPTSLIALALEAIPFSIVAPMLTMLGWAVWWLSEAQYLRYLLPALGCLALMIGWGTSKLVRIGTLTGIATRATISVGLIYALIVALWQSVVLTPFPVAIGLVTSEEFLRTVEPTYRVADFVNRSLPRRAVIATYGFPLGYYFDRRYLWADGGHNRLIRYEKLRGVEDLINEWERLGVTHVVIDWKFVPRESDLGRWISDGIERGLLERLWQEGAKEVLEVARRR
ncbi:MAG: ArnT family glycosyltransferase [Candidatus Fervidibacter sp.]|uniref:ArnT family glycosyltransferase n=1 Tax=Candidatus Fervidibacter sp. TaxID=3100871 RepID=UPI004049D2DF